MRQGCARSLYDMLAERIAATEVLVQENEQIRRELHSYETCLAELDSAVKSSKQGAEMVRGLKTIIEQQLRQICYLSSKTQSSQEEARPARADKDGGRSAVGQLRAQNEELVAERVSLVQLINQLESQV